MMCDEAEHEVRQVALRLIEALPDGYPSPSVDVEPDGHVSLEWYKHPRRLLSISVSPDGTLYWAGLVDAEDPRGRCHFHDEFPAILLHWIRQVCFSTEIASR